MQHAIQDTLLRDSAHLANELTLPLSSARIEVQCLLQNVLNVSRAWLLAHPEQRLNQLEQTRYAELLQRRLAGEPIAYILGEREFFGLNFKVTRATLIPRPETELLVELALQRVLSTLSRPDGHPLSRAGEGQGKRDCGKGCEFRVLDLGAGSGAIALAIAHSRLDVCVLGCDASPAALEVARENARRLGITNASFAQGDWYEALDEQCFDLIVSNPPYVAEGDPHLMQGDLRFEPASALASGADGLRDIRRIAAGAPAHLVPGGWLLLEHGYDQAEAVRELLRQAGFSTVFSACDLAGIERVSGGRTALAEKPPFMDNPRP